tara:strand:+ start:8515 stop:8811 length:297 start_codon:yes stop_codon:yes gene_type:complete
MKICITAIALLFLTSCLIVLDGPVHDNSSNNFQVAKAMIELTDITKNKDAIRRFKRVERISPETATLYPEFGPWYKKFGETIADRAVDKVLKMEIAGQ